MRVPFLLAGHIQEDAYITWRVARVLVESGTYGFNPTETVSASSSHAYVILCALVRLATGRWFVPMVLVINTLLLIAGLLRLASVFFDDPRRRNVLWVMVATLPVALQVTYSGMETSLLFFLISVLVADFAKYDRPTWVGLVAAAVLPWVRPEGFVWPVISAIGFAHKDRSFLVRTAVVTVASTSILCLVNVVAFGSIVNQTVVAKSLAYNGSLDVDARISNLKSVFIGNAAANVPGIFVPIYSRFLVWLGPIALAVTGAASLYWLIGTWHQPDRRARFLVLAGFAYGPPIAYAVGGVIFAWYLWPSRLVGFALVTAAALDISRRFSRTIERSTIWVGALAIAIMAAAEWTVAFHWGEREARFLTHIGYELRDAATPTDTLLLEPAGYISYFAGIHTDDEVGLVSRRVTAYRQRFGAAWWIHFVSDERPTFLVEREPMLTYRTTDGYRLSPSEQRWFERNYRLARTFAYNPLEHYQNRFLVRLLSTRPLPGNLYWYRHVDD